jgi:ABC-type antimicrobial peptide transport system permease subunit
MFLVARTATPPAALTASLRRSVRGIDPDLPVTNLRSVSDLVSAALSRQRFNTLLLGVFALAALALASVGLYGVMSYLVAQRTREIGVRVALGAHPSQVRGLVVKESLLIAGAGLVVGVVASLALSRLVAGLLYGVAPVDIPTYASIVALLFVVALAAAYGPARRATRIDPVAALRE